ncbi:hypothetical protein HPB51_020389 [Rhipicephalus microplus]|uniref:Uncharacterized protein n=1 Tax=Rhipicephalus microplus TaxID=6941 RepID=A0A9J6DW58_RHIMP|nr:hypothetical protein HPB51_020389 [Rhipicephalus microplus]
MVENAFKKGCISNSLDSTEDDALWEAASDKLSPSEDSGASSDEQEQLRWWLSTEDIAGVSAEVWNELAEFPGAMDGSTFDEFVSADDEVAIMNQLQDEDYIADVVRNTSQSDSNKEIDDGPLPTSSEVISALALVRRYFVNLEGCFLSCSDSLDHVEACVLSQAVKSLTEKKIRDYFVPQ